MLSLCLPGARCTGDERWCAGGRRLPRDAAQKLSANSCICLCTLARLVACLCRLRVRVGLAGSVRFN